MGLNVWWNLKMSYSLNLKWSSRSPLSSICSPDGGALWDAIVPLRDEVQLAEVHHWGQTIQGWV